MLGTAECNGMLLKYLSNGFDFHRIILWSCRTMQIYISNLMRFNLGIAKARCIAIAAPSPSGWGAEICHASIDSPAPYNITGAASLVNKTKRQLHQY
jgi:hypothetical protein